VLGGFFISLQNAVIWPAVGDGETAKHSACNAAIGSIVQVAGSKPPMTNGGPAEQRASLLATRLAVFCHAEVAPRLLGVCRHISTSGRGDGDDVIVTWSVACR